MKILYSTKQLYKFGGAERVTTIKLNALALRGHDVILVTSQQRRRKMCYPLHEKVKHYDLHIGYNEEKSFFSFLNILNAFVHLFRMYFLLRREKPDIIVCVGLEPDYIFLPFLFKKIPKIREFHSSRFSSFQHKSLKKFSFSYLYLKFIERIESSYSANVVLNKKERTFFKQQENVFVIPNPIMLQKFPNKVSKKRKVVAMGRIAQIKGYDLLLKSWSIVHKKHPDWLLEIYGDGDDNLLMQYQKEVEYRNLTSSVYFYKPVTDVFPILLSSSIFALSSRGESFGMVILEAQMCGLPVVAFDCPTGPGSIINNQVDGILVSPYDTNSFAEELCSLIEDQRKRYFLGNNAIKNVEKYSDSVILAKWEDLFSSLLKKSK